MRSPERAHSRGVQREQAEQAAGDPPDPRPVPPLRGRLSVAEVLQDRSGGGVPQPFEGLAEDVLGAAGIDVPGELLQRVVERVHPGPDDVEGQGRAAAAG